MVDGLGTPEGCTVPEQILIALNMMHDCSMENMGVDEDLRSAVKFECENATEDVDALRHLELSKLVDVVQSSAAEWEVDFASVPDELKLLLSPLNFPVWREMIRRLDLLPGGYTDKQVLTALVEGFPLIGNLPASGYSAAQITPGVSALSEEAFLRRRLDLNNRVLQKAKREQPFSGDLSSIASDEAEWGAMSHPQPMQVDGKFTKSYCRRIPIREEKSSGWRTRPVDHMTESGHNAATSPGEAVRNDSIDVMLFIILQLLAYGFQPRLWKRDFSKAYRRLGIFWKHLPLAWVAWFHDGEFLEAQHFAMPMGSISAVHAWHRVGSVIIAYMRKVLRCPVGRYVDDFFSASRDGIFWCGGACLDLLASLLGLPLDSAKSVTKVTSMLLLGARLSTSTVSMDVVIAVAEDKAAKWDKDLSDILENQCCDPVKAGKMAGRLSFLVTTAADKIGRAYIRPFYAQSAEPLAGNAASPLMSRSASFFRHYLRSGFARRFNPRMCREHINCWSDAAGSTRVVAAVIYIPSVGWRWTCWKPPDGVFKSLLVRNDEQIGFQELAGVILCLRTFRHWLCGQLVTMWNDNQGVLHSILSGSGLAPEINACVARLWILVAKMQLGFRIGRVESKANVADGPSRLDLEWMENLGAVWTDAEVPSWLLDPWQRCVAPWDC